MLTIFSSDRIGSRAGQTGHVQVPIWLAVAFVGSLLAAPAVAQATDEILLVKSGDTTLYRQVEKAFETELDRLCPSVPACPEIRSLTADELQDAATATYRLVILVGQKASRLADRVSPDSRQLHILVSQQDYAKVSACCGETHAIYLEQPLLRQLEFTRFLLPERRRVAVLLGEYSRHLKDELESLARGTGMDIQFRQVDSPQDIGRLLHDLRDEADLLLSLPDPYVYNQNTLTGILLSTYRNHIPVIGFSRGMVKSGALAALHSTPETVGREAAQKALDLLDGKTDSSFDPGHFDFSLNRTVARSLHLQLPTDDEMNQRWGSE